MANTERHELPNRTEEEHRRVRKRKLDDLEVLEREMALMERELAVKKNTFQWNMTIMDAFGAKDAQILAATRDNIKNLVMGTTSTTLAIEDKNAFLPDLSAIAKELSGKSLPTKTLALIGRRVSKAYKAKYGHTTPDKTMRFCNGVNVEVNAYRVGDKALVYDEIRSFLASSSGARISP